MTLRPIRPEDEAQHLDFLEHLDPEDIRLRVFYSRRSIESELARLTQIDYAREMAFVATAPDALGYRAHAGRGARRRRPDNVEAEFGIIVRSEMKGPPDDADHRLPARAHAPSVLNENTRLRWRATSASGEAHHTSRARGVELDLPCRRP